MEVKRRNKQTQLGVIPEGWDSPTLGDLFTFKNGLNKAKHFFGHGTPIVNYMDVYGSRGIFANDIRGRVSLSRKEIKAFEVRKGDVFFTRTSEIVEEVGIASVMLDEPYDTVFSGFIIRAHPKDNSLDDQFKKYCFSTNTVRKQIVSQSTETTRALTSGKCLSIVAIVRPPKAEQVAIANVLSDADVLISNLEKLVAKKRNIKLGAMQQLLTGKKRLPGFSSDWGVTRLGDIAAIKKGQMITERNVVAGDIPVIAGGIVPSYYHDTSNRKANTITISASGANAGYVLFHTEPIFASDCSTIEENIYYDIRYLFYLLQSRQQDISKLQTGGAQPHVYPGQLKTFNITIPRDKAEQTAIAQVLSDMDAEIEALERKLAKYKLIKLGMMQQLLTGKKRLI